jgi:peroxiredoxin
VADEGRGCAGRQDCMPGAERGIEQSPGSVDRDPEELIRRVIGVPLPTTGLRWTDEHPDVRPRPVERSSLAAFAARHTLLVYLAAAEDDRDPEADTMGRALRDLDDALLDLGVDTVGISTQPVAEQHDLAGSELFTQRLCSDAQLALAKTLGLPITTIAGKVEYEPVILIVEEGRIAHVIYPVVSPRASAREALDWFTEQTDCGADGPPGTSGGEE